MVRIDLETYERLKRKFSAVCSESSIFTPAVVARVLGVSMSTAYNYLHAATKFGIVERVGRGLYRCTATDSGSGPSHSGAAAELLPLEKAIASLRSVLDELKAYVVNGLAATLRSEHATLKNMVSEALARLSAVERGMGSLRRVVEELRREVEELKRAVNELAATIEASEGVELTISTKPSDEELMERIEAVLSQKQLLHYSEIREELKSMGIDVSTKKVVKILRRMRELGRVFEVAPAIFSVYPNIPASAVREKVMQLRIVRAPAPVTGATIYRVIVRNNEVLVIPAQGSG